MILIECQHLFLIADSGALDAINHRPKIFYYANLNCDHNVIGPWQLVSLLQKSCTPNAITMSDIVVISDSDDDGDHETLCKYFFFFGIYLRFF